MNEAVFISDLHLHPAELAICQRFEKFITWAGKNTKSVYILGDFLHAWAGDDGICAWSKNIASQLATLSDNGVKVFFMHGNRDFLLGNKFAKLANFHILKEPTIIKMANLPILLTHGDRYCSKDKSHQWFRRLTRNKVFTKIFLCLPYKMRHKLVAAVRQQSSRKNKKPTTLDIEHHHMLAHMEKMRVETIIHGHIHKYGQQTYVYNNEQYLQYVLSDWDDIPQVLCYHEAKGFYFEPLGDRLCH